MSRGKDTVITKSSPPDPERETYLSLLKGAVSPSEKNVKVKVKKENAGFMTPHGGKSPPDQKKETYANLLKNTIKVRGVEVKDADDDEDEKEKITIKMTDDYRNTDYERNSPNLLPKK